MAIDLQSFLNQPTFQNMDTLYINLCLMFKILRRFENFRHLERRESCYYYRVKKIFPTDLFCRVSKEKQKILLRQFLGKLR